MTEEKKNTEKAEAKAKADALAEVEALAKAGAEAKIKEDEEVEAKAKADAKKFANPTRRVFRQVRPRIMRNTIIKTLMEHSRQVGDAKIPGRLAEVAPNNASQYVLGAGAIEYGKQLGVLLKRVARGDLVEVDASEESVPFVSQDEKDLAQHDRKARALRKKLGVPEPETVI